MSEDLERELINAGYPWGDGKFNDCPTCGYDGLMDWFPTLEHLIKACGEEFELTQGRGNWYAKGGEVERNYLGSFDYMTSSEGTTPEEAVARLWLELNKTKNPR